MHYRLPTDQGSAWVFSLDQSRSNGTTTVAGSPTAFTAYSSQVGVGFSFPLMQGSEERINRLGIDQADIAVLRSEAAVNNAARNLRNGIIQAYIGAVLNERQIEVAQLSLDTAKNLVEQTQARIDVGLLAPYELLAAESGLAEREEAILNAQAALKTSLDSLKALIGIPITDEIQLDEGILQALSLDVDPDQLFYEAQQNRPDYLDIDLQVRQAQLTLLAAQDRTRASLVWSTQLHLSGQDTGYLRSLGDLNSFAWSTGLQYKIPLGGNRAAVADESTAEINLQQLQLEKVDFLRGLERDIRSAVVDLNSALLRMDVTAQGLHVQEVKMESERARLDLGLNKARDFLQFDLDLANARIAYYSAMGDAYLAVGRLESLVNENLLDRITVIGGTSEPSVEVPK
jgi:outer membrane protein TolC